MAEDTPDFPDFDPDLDPLSEHNISVGRQFGLTWDSAYGVWRDADGCPCYDRYGQYLG
jgi:hypothetical protein